MDVGAVLNEALTDCCCAGFAVLARGRSAVEVLGASAVSAAVPFILYAMVA